MSTIPNSQDDVQKTIKDLIQKNAEHEVILDKLNQMFPDGDDDLISKIYQSMNDKNNADDMLNEISSLLPSSSNKESGLTPKSKSKQKQKGKYQHDNLISRLKNQLNNDIVNVYKQKFHHVMQGDSWHDKLLATQELDTDEFGVY